MRTKNALKTDVMFIERWSPRSFLSDSLRKEDIDALFEAARWSPSCYNDQPWHFVYATEGQALRRLQSVLVEGNQIWANQAPLLMIVFARKSFTHNHKPNAWAKFDAGAATMAMQFQALKLGLSCHPMAGFSAEKAYEVCGVNPDTHEAICAMAVGKRGPKDILSEELQDREAPSDRHPVSDFVRELS